MPRAQNPSESSRADWLPWFLSIFVALCAAFVLVKGVLPARSVNAHLLERVSRLETAAQNASSERASLEQAKGHLLEQYTSVQAQLSTSGKEHERALQVQQLARKEMSETFAEQIAAGDLWIEQRPSSGANSGVNSELVIGISERVLFNGDHAEVTWKGRRFLKALAENLKHLPADQAFEIDSHFAASEDSQNDSSPKQNYKKAETKPRSGWDVSARRAASVARRLEEDGGLSGSQLIATGLSRYHSGSDASNANAAASRSIELVLLAKRS